MGLTLVNLSGYQRGIESAETGINVESFSVRYYLQFKDYLNNYQGQIQGFAGPDKFSRELNLSGEVAGGTGIMASVCYTAMTITNDVSVFVATTGGSNAGGFYMDEVTETQTRDGWRAISLKATSNPLVT